MSPSCILWYRWQRAAPWQCQLHGLHLSDESPRQAQPVIYSLQGTLYWTPGSILLIGGWGWLPKGKESSPTLPKELENEPPAQNPPRAAQREQWEEKERLICARFLLAHIPPASWQDILVFLQDQQILVAFNKKQREVLTAYLQPGNPDGSYSWEHLHPLL